MKPWVRLIGDVHGYMRGPGRSYLNLIEHIPFSVVLGDFGWHDFDNDFYNILSCVDATHHRAIAGNHDNYDRLTPHFLGDYGFHTFQLPKAQFGFFFIRGGRSIDTHHRTIGIDWWDCEELTWPQGYALLEEYKNLKPLIVLTHECPIEILSFVTKQEMTRSRTQQILQACFEVHQPQYWFFGHFHRNLRIEHKGTTFMCLDGHLPEYGSRMSYVDFDENGQLLTPKPI